MAKSRKSKRDPLPEQFNSAEEAGEFWDTHSGADYEEHMQEAHFEVDLKQHSTEVRVSDQLLRDVRRGLRRWLHLLATCNSLRFRSVPSGCAAARRIAGVVL